MKDLLETARRFVVTGHWIDGAWSLLVAVIVVGGAVLLAKLLQAGLEQLRKREGPAAPLIYIVEKVGGYTIILIGVLTGLSTLGIDLRSFTVFAGAVGVGLGLGLQGIVKDFVSGLVLIFDPSIQVGDFVELEDGVRGEIAEIGPRATRLRTNDDLHVVIPNSTMIQSRVHNWTYNHGTRRIHVPFSVAEDADTAKVRDVVLAAAKALPFTPPDSDGRSTQVWMTGFSGSGLDFELIVWPTPESARHPASMHAAYTWAIYQALVAAGIDNATRQLDLRLRNLFGREGDHALKALKLGEAEPSPRPSREQVPNDAAAAVYEDATRGDLARAEPRGREPVQKAV